MAASALWCYVDVVVCLCRFELCSNMWSGVTLPSPSVVCRTATPTGIKFLVLSFWCLAYSGQLVCCFCSAFTVVSGSVFFCLLLKFQRVCVNVIDTRTRYHAAKTLPAYSYASGSLQSNKRHPGTLRRQVSGHMSTGVLRVILFSESICEVGEKTRAHILVKKGVGERKTWPWKSCSHGEPVQAFDLWLW